MRAATTVESGGGGKDKERWNIGRCGSHVDPEGHRGHQNEHYGSCSFDHNRCCRGGMKTSNFRQLGKRGVAQISLPAVDQTDRGVIGLQQTRGVIQTAGFIEEKGQASDPSQYQCGHVMRDGWLLFSIRGMVMFSKILIQSERSVRCTDMHGHGDANTKAAEKVDQDHLVQRTRHEKFNGGFDTRQIAGHH
uniref:Uncharacterized protein n=1 Tax=Romanomermis culicivorax TaxID=13658 RepID=A0A915IIY8_ROMCU